MFPLGTHFDELLKNIRPPQERLDAARDLPPQVREYLETHNEFVTVPPHTRLAGSYAQKMSVGDVKDVDFLVSVPGDPDANEPEAKQLIRSLREALDGLPEALGFNGYARVDIERARRSVHVYIESRDFHLDVVPCIAPDGFDEPIYVPDWGFNEWVQSHPLGLIDLLGDLNAAHGRKVKKLGRLLKHFRNYQMKNRKPKSYWLVAMVVQQVQKGKLDTSQPLAVLFRDLLDAIYYEYEPLWLNSRKETPDIPDPMLGHNISWNWERTHFETFMRRLEEGCCWATKALESGDRGKAVEYWQQVFGEEYFPSDISEPAANAAKAGWPEQTFVTASGLVVPTKPVAGVFTPTPRTTFHGEEDA